MEIYVINLKRRQDRYSQFLEWNSNKELKFTCFEAINGNELILDDLVKNKQIISKYLNYSRGAIGNAISHWCLWQNCVIYNKPIIVIEDDAYISDQFKNWLDKIEEEINNCDILYLGHNGDATTSLGYGGGWWNFPPTEDEFDKRIKKVNQDRIRNVFEARMVWGTLAYAISPKSAKKLLKTCFPLTARLPILLYGSGTHCIPNALDGELNSLIQAKRIKARAVFPALVIGPNSHKDSDVQSFVNMQKIE